MHASKPSDSPLNWHFLPTLNRNSSTKFALFLRIARPKCAEIMGTERASIVLLRTLYAHLRFIGDDPHEAKTRESLVHTRPSAVDLPDATADTVTNLRIQIHWWKAKVRSQRLSLVLETPGAPFAPMSGPAQLQRQPGMRTPGQQATAMSHTDCVVERISLSNRHLISRGKHSCPIHVVHCRCAVVLKHTVLLRFGHKTGSLQSANSPASSLKCPRETPVVSTSHAVAALPTSNQTVPGPRMLNWI